MCRPRYFSGQLLTESDLAAEQEWAIQKHRLHNLHLHGSGVVCGMQVVCHPSCHGWVTVKQGYAIGPCGDDIVLCEDQHLDVVAYLERCERERRRRRPEDCAPYAAPNTDCGLDGTWCLTVEYCEQATRPIAALRPETQAGTPVCTCGSSTCACGNGNGNGGCGCGGSAGHVHECEGGAARTPLGVPCEPSRICEGFRLGLSPAPAEAGDTVTDLLGDTLLGRVTDCLRELQVLDALAPEVGDQLGPAERRSACCRYLTAVRRYLETHDVTRCEIRDTIGRMTCPSPGDVAEPTEYPQRVNETVLKVRALLVLQLLDCFCLQLLPPCPSDPGDPRLGLAAVTVRDGEVVRICNLECRRQAWTWPAVRYWLSAFPIEQVLALLLQRLCCGELGFGRSADLLDRRYLDAAAAPAAVAADPEALLRQMGELLRPLADRGGD
jgi:hypothetical protein